VLHLAVPRRRCPEQGLCWLTHFLAEEGCPVHLGKGHHLFRSEPRPVEVHLEEEHWNPVQNRLKDQASAGITVLFPNEFSAYVSDRAEILELAYW
jgi:hypothetical protein